jgi:hypothetical protein
MVSKKGKAIYTWDDLGEKAPISGNPPKLKRSGFPSKTVSSPATKFADSRFRKTPAVAQDPCHVDLSDFTSR